MPCCKVKMSAYDCLSVKRLVCSQCMTACLGWLTLASLRRWSSFACSEFRLAVIISINSTMSILRCFRSYTDSVPSKNSSLTVTDTLALTLIRNGLPQAVAQLHPRSSLNPGSRATSNSLILTLVTFSSLWFACCIKSGVVEGLGLCRLGFNPGKGYASRTGLAWDPKKITAGSFLSLLL